MRAMCAIALLAACIESKLVPCGDLACPIGNVCTPGGCANPDDVAACDGLADGQACRSAGGGIGTCQGGACRTGLCGNCVVDVGEACDDCNQVSGDGCRGDCKKIEVCGDLVLDEGEQCDDGNHNPADGCDACRLTSWSVSVAVGMQLSATGVELANPGGVAVDGAGRVFVADTDNHRVVRVDPDGSLTIVAGTGTVGFAGDGGAATSAQLAFPSAVAIDGLGRLLIADTQNQRVRRVEIDGTITTVAGSGVYGYAGDGSDASIAELANPSGVAVDGFGRVFVADTDNARIRLVDIDHTISTFAGDGVAGFAGDGGLATAAELSSPFGIALDGQGRLVIGDTVNQRVRRVELDGTIATIAGTGVAGYGGDGGPATAAQLSYPAGVAIDAQGRIAIADVLDYRVRWIDASGTITTVAGLGAKGYGGDGGFAILALLANPLGVAFSPQGTLVIADSGNQRVREVDAAGTITTIAGTGAFGSGGDGGAATASQLTGPYSVIGDAVGHIYIADTLGARIRRVELDGTIATIAGTGIAGFSTGSGGLATATAIDNPIAVALDATGRVYLTDTNNQRIRRVELDGTMTTVAGTAIAGFSGDGGLATSAQLWNPGGVAVDGAGRIYIGDTHNQRIRVVDTDGTISTFAGNGTAGYSGDGGPATSAELAYPYGVTFDGLGRLIIGDAQNNRVRRVELDGTISTIAGTGASGFSGDGGPATAAQLADPRGVAVDALGRVYIAEGGNERVRRINTDGTIETIAGGALGGDGDGGPATSAQLASPFGVGIDAQGRVLIADTDTDRIRRVESDGTIVTVAGQIDPRGVGRASVARLVDVQAIVATPALLLAAGGTSGTLEALRNAAVEVVAGRYPQATATGGLARFRTRDFGDVGGVAFDATRGLAYIAETTANRLHVVTIVDPAHPATWTIAPLANVAGTPGFADGAVATALFRSPRGLFLDASARVLYVADTGNHAIRALDLAAGTVTTIVDDAHQLGFAGDGGPATAALLFEPAAVTRCANGDLFVADTGNNRVRRVANGVISTVLGDGVRASSGEGSPATTFPVAAPRGLACDEFGNLYVSSSTALRLLPASDAGIVDGTGAVQTIYGAPPRAGFPQSITGCLTGVAVTSATTLLVADACTGLLVQLSRE